MNIDRVVDCPECHVYCEWCAWYAKNARECGCGLSVPTGYGRPSKRRCEWGEAQKGRACSTCDGSGKARLIGQYVPVGGDSNTGFRVDPVVDSGRD